MMMLKYKTFYILSQKYKLAMFYFQVLNIPVQFRSKLQTIFLYGICRSKHLTKFGLNNFIKNFTDSGRVTITRHTDVNLGFTIFSKRNTCLCYL